MTRLQITTLSEEETLALGERLGRALHAGDVVALEGELGAGKTRLVQGIAHGLGLRTARVNSPTFVLVNVYPGLKNGGGLVHMDAYRIGSEDELAALGWDRLCDGGNIIVVEWAGRIAGALPPNRFDVRLEHAGADRRLITVSVPEGRSLSSGGCRVCGAPAKSGPFCSDRCKMADLGKWFSGDYTISRPLTERDVE